MLSELMKRERKKKKGVILWLFSSLLIVISMIVILTQSFDTVFRKNNALNLKNELLTNELNETNKNITELTVSANIDDNQINRIVNSISGKRKEAIELALKFRKQGIPFKWGGKKPEEGFDSSGFIAFILNKVGIITNPEIYWSGKLREDFSNDKNDLNLLPGDLIFESNRACWFYLNDKYSIGMIPSGI